MAFDIDSFLTEPIRKTRFKDKRVEAGYAKVDPSLKAIAETIPATVTSTYRDPSENAAVGGVPNSYHTQGRALDYRKGELKDEDRNRLINAGYEIIPESDHDHVEPGKNFKPQKSSFDIDSFLSTPTEQPQNDPNQGLFKDNSLAISPLSIEERAKLGFGNQVGSLDYLKSKGQDAEYRDGGLYVGKGDAAVPADPSGFRTFGRANPLVNTIYSAMDLLEGPESASKNARRLLRDLKDLPSDIAEIPSDLVNMATTTGGAYGGAALGALTGPAAPAAVTVLSGLGGALGGIVSEKIKNPIGKALGVYKSDEFFDPDTQSAALWGGIGGALPALFQGGKAGVAKGSEKMKGLLKENKIPERLYGQATGLSDTIFDNPEITQTLLKKGVVPKFGQGIGSLQDVAEASKKTIGSKMNEALAGKTVSPDDVLPRLPNASKFSDDFAAGSAEAAEGSANKVLDELKNRLIRKEIQEIPGGVMKRPDYGLFREEFLRKNLPRDSGLAKAFVSNPEEANLDDILDYYLSRPSKQSNIAAINRSAGGYPASQSPIFSEKIVPKRIPKQYGEEFLPKDLLKKDFVPKRVFTPESSPNVIDDLTPTPTEEDILRLFQQQYPEEAIALPGKTVEKTLPIDLSRLNREKQLLGKEASRVFESEGLKGTARQKAQKQASDVLRRVVEEQVPEMRALNQDYHVFDELGEGLEKVLSKDFKRIPLIEEAPFKSRFAEIALGATKGGKARNAARLFRFANSPTPEANLKPSLFSYPAIIELINAARTAQE